MKDLNNKKRVLLISPKGWQKVSVNLGLALLSGALKNSGFDVLILDLCYHDMSDEEVVKIACEFNPFLIGLSVKTSQAKEAFRVANLLKHSCLDSVIVAGGPHVTLDPEFFFNYQSDTFDYCILSEGEISFTSLALHVLSGNKEMARQIEGVAYKDSESQCVIVNTWQPPSDISILPYPDFDSIYNFNRANFCYPIVSSRGCPYSCIYCCVNLLTGSKKWRCRTPESIIDEIKYAKKTYHISQFEFWDDNFTLDMDRAKKFCRLLIDSDLSLSWWCHNGIRADKLDDELASLMYQAGCTSVALGIESGTPDVFNSIQKGEALNDCVNAVRSLKKAGIKAVGYFIIGLPGDTLETFIETVRFQRNLKLDHFTFGLLVPYPGTKVWDIVEKRGSFVVDVTDSQHFSSELPTISFNLPEFPPFDIIVAYCITKYFELYECASRYLNNTRECSLTIYIDQIDGVIRATELLYSLYLFREKINVMLFTDSDTSIFNKNIEFMNISKNFNVRISHSGESQSGRSDIVVCSRALSNHIERRVVGKPTVFLLDSSNPIKALDKQ